MINYRPGFIPNKILIIGCGGTGSRLVPLLAQFIKTCAWVMSPEITLIDDDVVETKNLTRQNFIASDVGKGKAEVLAQRYSRAFNVSIVPHRVRVVYDGPEAVKVIEGTNKNAMKYCAEIFHRHAVNSLVIMCVDSPVARLHILKHVLPYQHTGSSNMLLIDSGNEDDFGQITISSAKVGELYNTKSLLKDMPQALPGDFDLPCIPMDISYFTEMTAVSAGSCADLDQTMAINTAMAVTMFGIIQNVFYAKPISFHRMNVTLTTGTTPEFITPRFLVKQYEACQTYGVKNRYGTKGVIEKDVGELPILDCYSSFTLFHRNVFTPFQALTNEAKAEQERKEKRERLADLAKIKAQAVAEAKAKFGWEEPGEKEAAQAKLASAVKAVADKKEEDIEKAVAAAKDQLAKPAKKKIERVFKDTYGTDHDADTRLRVDKIMSKETW